MLQFNELLEDLTHLFLDTFLTLARISYLQDSQKVLGLENGIGWAVLSFSYMQMPELPSKDEAVKF